MLAAPQGFAKSIGAMEPSICSVTVALRDHTNGPRGWLVLSLSFYLVDFILTQGHSLTPSTQTEVTAIKTASCEG